MERAETLQSPAARGELYKKPAGRAKRGRAKPGKYAGCYHILERLAKSKNVALRDDPLFIAIKYPDPDQDSTSAFGSGALRVLCYSGAEAADVSRRHCCRVIYFRNLSITLAAFLCVQ